MKLLTETYQDQIRGVLSCYDRMVVQGTLPGFCYPEGMTSYLNQQRIRIFDYPQFVQPLRDKLILNAQQIAQKSGVEIEYIKKKNFRKEDRIAAIIKKRGSHPGIVHIFSTLELCTSYKPWHDKKSHRTYLKYDSGKCLHYYFYFIDEQLGLCYVRVPTWCPFRLQIYFNGHNLLASALTKKNINHMLIDNVFIDINDFSYAQTISDSFNVETLHKILDRFAKNYCPVIKQFPVEYHWSIMQAEYSTDIVFKKQSDLQNIYDSLVRTTIYTVKPEHIATFLGRKLHPNYQDEMGNNFDTRIHGTRIKHSMGPVSIKMYDKLGLVLRIETTVNNVSFFKHYRKVEQRDGSSVLAYASMKKGIYNLSPLKKLLLEANSRYLEFISTISDRTNGIKNVMKVSKTVIENNRSYRGFNFFAENDLSVLIAIERGEFNISGFQNKNIRSKLANKNTGQISRILARLRFHGLIKMIGRTYKYYLTVLGRRVIAVALKIKELFIVQELCY